MAITDTPVETPAEPPSGSSPWLTGIFAPVPDEMTSTALTVHGELPSGLRGAFLRNGPNAQFAPLGRYHLFDGDGMVHGVWLDGEGGVRYANRWIESAGLLAERQAGEALFGGLSDFKLPPDEVFAAVGPVKNTANTALVHHADRLFGLMEGCPPTELTLDQLATVGQYNYGGALRGSMTAHPKIDPVTGELVFFGYSPVSPYLRVHAADAAGELTWSTVVDLPEAVMMHDFVITATRVVVFDLPAIFDLNEMISGGEGIRWDLGHQARIGILERGAPGETIQWIDVDPFWVFHFLNAHDEADGAIVAHGCRAERLNTSFGDEDLEDPARPMLHRWRIDPAAGTVTTEQLSDRTGDFPRMNDRRAGLEARYGYLARTPDERGEVLFDGVTKHDLHTGQSLTAGYGADTIAGEPVFTPNPDGTAEDDGWILNWVHDLDDEVSSMVVLDAANLSEVARIDAPRRVPFGFHGTFVPATD